MDPSVVSLVFVTIAVVLLYFVPWLVARNRRHRQLQAILALNLFLGWTFVGWVAALVWSLTDNTQERPA